MYLFVGGLFALGLLLVVAGFIGRMGTEGLNDVDKNVAASFGLLATYSMLILSLSSFSELSAFFEEICGEIPFLGEISTYGSLHRVFEVDPMSGIMAFMDSVILATLIDLLVQLVPTGSARNETDKTGKRRVRDAFMVEILTGTLAAIISVCLLNYVIKTSSVYQYVAAAIGAVVVIVSVGSIPFSVLSTQKKDILLGTGILGILFIFSKTWIVGVLRASFLKSIIYVLGIWWIEENFGSLGAGLSFVSTLAVAFGPVIVMLIGLALIIKSAFSK